MTAASADANLEAEGRRGVPRAVLIGIGLLAAVALLGLAARSVGPGFPDPPR